MEGHLQLQILDSNKEAGHHHLGFMALSSLIVNAYCQMGHSARVVSSFSQQLFHLAAVIYVDNTDLLHWPSSLCINQDKLVEHVQQAMSDYGRIAIAFGGILKEKKCSIIYLTINTCTDTLK
jgi:hypothetical protein